MAAAAHRVILSACAGIFLIGALAIPMYYETTTLWYKIGLDKILLKGGQFIGLTAFVLICLQLVLATRGAYLEKVFGAAELLRYHRLNGLLIAFLASCHVLLILVPEGLANLPIGRKFWPEMVGAALFLLLLATTLSAYYRQKFRRQSPLWRHLHRSLGYLILLLVCIHVLFVSDSFEQPIPRAFVIVLFAGLVIWISAGIWLKYRTNKMHSNQPSGERI